MRARTGTEPSSAAPLPWWGARIASHHPQTPHNPKSSRRGGDERASRLPLTSDPFPEADLALLQGQTPRHRDGAQHSPHGRTPSCWGDARARELPTALVCPFSVCPTALPPQQRALPANESRWRPGGDREPQCRDLPCPCPCPRPSASPASRALRRGTPGAKGCPHVPQPHLPGRHLAPPRGLRNFSFGKAAGVHCSARFPRPSEPALLRRSFLGNEQPPAESPTPPALCYCSCQVLNVAAVVVVTTPSHFAFN